MRVGLIGAHGVGKSTLAEAVSNETDLPLIFTRTAKVFERLGLRPDQKLPFIVRMTVQQHILSDAVELWDKHLTFITDRTPLDMLAYTMVDIGSETRLSKEELHFLEQYTAACFAATNKYFSTVVLIQPGLPLVNDKKARAGMDKALIEKMNTIMMGLLCDPRCRVNTSYIHRHRLDLNERVESVQFAIEDSVISHVKGFENAAIH